MKDGGIPSRIVEKAGWKDTEQDNREPRGRDTEQDSGGSGWLDGGTASRIKEEAG